LLFAGSGLRASNRLGALNVMPLEISTLGSRSHATYTKEYRIAPPEPADHYARQAFLDLVQFSDRELRGRAANT
jgi:hypothetical protein